MHTDPIADLLTRIRNAQNAGHKSVTIPYSKIKQDILKILAEKHWITKYEIVKNSPMQEINVTLNQERGRIELKRISKPGQKIYMKQKNIKKVKNGLGISIISTSKGIMTGEEAYKSKLGGEMLCEIY